MPFLRKPERFALLCLALCGLLATSTAHAQSISTIVRTSTSRGLTSSRSIATYFDAGPRQSFYVSAEYVRDTSFPDAIADQLRGKHTWKLKTLPFTFGYRRYLTGSDHRIRPVVSGGISYYFTRLKQLDTAEPMGLVYSRAATPDSPRSFVKRYGMGFGAEATFGLQARLTHRTYVLAQGRGRFVDGLAFTHPEADAQHAEFAEIDFSLGLGFDF